MANEEYDDMPSTDDRTFGTVVMGMACLFTLISLILSWMQVSEYTK